MSVFQSKTLDSLEDKIFHSHAVLPYRDVSWFLLRDFTFRSRNSISSNHRTYKTWHKITNIQYAQMHIYDCTYYNYVSWFWWNEFLKLHCESIERKYTPGLAFSLPFVLPPPSCHSVALPNFYAYLPHLSLYHQLFPLNLLSDSFVV